MAKRKKRQKKQPAFLSNLKANLKEHSPIILFCLGVGLIMFVYYWMYNQDFFDTYINKPVVTFYANAGSIVLNIFGMATETQDSILMNEDFTMNVSKGCDALSPTFLILAAVLVFPIAFRWKVPALLIAPPIIGLLNILRIISLFLIGIHIPSLFEIAHIEIWQTLFIIFCLLGWFYWLVWAIRKKQKHEGA